MLALYSQVQSFFIIILCDRIIYNFVDIPFSRMSLLYDIYWSLLILIALCSFVKMTYLN